MLLIDEMWNFLPEYVVNAPSVDSFDKQWSNEDILYDYKAAAPAARKIFAPAGTQEFTIVAKACGHEDTVKRGEIDVRGEIDE